MNLPNDQDSASNGPPRGTGGEPLREAEPMEVDIVKIIGIGTVLFAIAFVVMLPLRTSLDNAGHGRWPWVALSGVVLGLMGLVITFRRARRLQKGNDL